MIVTIMQK